MRLLVTNDDGIFAEGIQVLAKLLRQHNHDVWLVAPDRERSATSHALTLDRPLRLQEVGKQAYTVNGTPTDCVNLGIFQVMKAHPPAMVLSGINFGVNICDDVTYSGTVSAAFEGHLLGFPAIALSQEIGSPTPFQRSARWVVKFLSFLEAHDFITSNLLLNINFPATRPQGVVLTRLGKRHYQESIVEKLDPRGKKYYWIGGSPQEGKLEEGTDYYALSHGMITITPLHLDLTDYQKLEAFQGIANQLNGP